MITIIDISFNNITVYELVIAIVGYIIVFIALLSLYGLFRLTPGIIQRMFRQKAKPDNQKSAHEVDHISGEETAAIAMALHLYFDELHDEESGILTIKKVSKAYSPWSSKIYAVRNQFNRI